MIQDLTAGRSEEEREKVLHTVDARGTTESVPLAYVDGRILPLHEASVSVLDSGLNFADGVFEGIRVYDGRVFRLEEHLDRLYESAAVFEIEIGLE